MQLDQSILDIIETWRTPFATNVFEGITFFGSAPVITGISLIVMSIVMIHHRKRTGVLFAYLTVCDALITFILKNFFHRTRPDPLEQLIQETGYSLPSGHSSSSMFLYGAIAVLVVPLIPSRAGRIIVSILTALWILLIGTSRIYLGVHYPSDVFAGYMIGAILLAIFAWKKPKTPVPLH